MRIAIDAGHGMGNRTPGLLDPGACAGGVREADVALAYALALNAALTAVGMPTWLTRESNLEPTPVSTRAMMAARAGCTVFVSLHLNAAESTAARGLEVLYRAPKDLPLARELQRRLAAFTGFVNRGTKMRTDLAVLKFAPGPAVLIELGFITNAAERVMLTDSKTQARIVAAIAGVLREMFTSPKPAVLEWRGKMSTFGGPDDMGVSPAEGLALLVPTDVDHPRFKSLFLPAQPPGTTGLARRLNPHALYVACRWPYTDLPEEGRKLWKQHLRSVYARVSNPRTGLTLEAMPVDWGPNERTTRVADLSPGLADKLALETDDDCIVTIPPLDPA